MILTSFERGLAKPNDLIQRLQGLDVSDSGITQVFSGDARQLPGTVFTDVEAAIDEAVYLADEEYRPQAIIRCDGGFIVMSYSDAWFEHRDILEAISPVEGAA